MVPTKERYLANDTATRLSMSSSLRHSSRVRGSASWRSGFVTFRTTIAMVEFTHHWPCGALTFNSLRFLGSASATLQKWLEVEFTSFKVIRAMRVILKD